MSKADENRDTCEGKDAPSEKAAQGAGRSGYPARLVSRQWLRSVGELRSGEKGSGYESEELYFVGRGVMRASLCLVTAPRTQRVRVGVPGSSTKQEVLRPGLMVAAARRAEKRRWV